MSAVASILASLELLSVLPPDSSIKPSGRNRWRGNCPIDDHKSRGTFSVALHADGHQVFYCFACNLRGSVIDLVAAMDGSSVATAIRKLSKNSGVFVSPEAIMQRAHDAHVKNFPGYAVVVCDDCGDCKKIDSELDFVIESYCGGFGGWEVCSDGSARCSRCNVERRQNAA